MFGLAALAFVLAGSAATRGSDEPTPPTCPLCGGGPDVHALALARWITVQGGSAVTLLTSSLR